MNNTRFLTKSRFKLALSCPTKLYYTDKSTEYSNSSLNDPFLEALAKGGFQVGELAKCYFPEGIEVKGLDKEKVVAETSELLMKKNVVIFEAAIMFKNLFVRVDILEKKDNVINFYEVKSKSADPNKFSDELWNKNEIKKGIHSLTDPWYSYIYDVAFQAFVLKNVFPKHQVNSYLMCTDKTSKTSVDNLNQKFILKKDKQNRTYAEINGTVDKKSLGDEIICRLDITDVVRIIHDEKEMSERFEGKGFAGAIWYFAEMYEKDQRIKPAVGSHCKGCEFRKSEEDKKCGFNECWNLAHGMDKEELAKPFVFDVWNFRGTEKAIKEGKHLLEELDESDINVKQGDGDKLSQGERQWLQIEKVKNNDQSPYINTAGLKKEFSQWTYPLHMIDFETCMVAIPFNKGKRPYEQIAFQFSHHVIYESGEIEHKDEFINNTPGSFPNFEFVRALKKALEKDSGTIFCYSYHENTVLCQIKEQLIKSIEIDKDDLISFIETIASQDKQWKGSRKMVDMCDLVKKYYYSPATKGSNSIKYVLPAILNESDFIKKKYAQPSYSSKNFKKHTWIKIGDNGKVIDPYKSLPAIFDNYDYETLELVTSDKEINNGGAAMTAYAMMQFTQMSEIEREKVSKSLLRYCELDTLAMVMIWEHWNHLIGSTEDEEAA